MKSKTKKIVILLILLFGVTNFTNAQWIQIGDDIDGEVGDVFGESVSLNSNGSIMAIGAIGNTAGYVRVYEFINEGWVQMGSDINGEAPSDQSGCSISLNSDGTIIAIGASSNDGNGTNTGHVRIYKYYNGNWVQMGSDINGETHYDQSGCSVSLNYDGTIVAIGASSNDGNGTDAGHVRIYKYYNGNWVQMGSDINGEAPYDQSGCSVSLNSDGTIVAIGASCNDGNGTDAGHVRIYKYCNGNWVQMGSDINGEAAGDQSGSSISLSFNGIVVAIGAPNNSGNGISAGQVRIYEYSNGSWTKIGNDIDAKYAGEFVGCSVSLSFDGTVVAIGGHESAIFQGNDGRGNVRIYNYNNISWNQIGNDIDGEAVHDYSGYSLSLCSNGSKVSIGAPYNSQNGISAGHVRAFFTPSSVIDDSKNCIRYELIQNYPNPFNPITTIKYALPQTSNVKIRVFNITGSEVATLLNGQINGGIHSVNFDGSRYTSGLYYYTLEAEGKVIATQKMLMVK